MSMKPMDEAPKDGRYILVCDGGIPVVVRWQDDAWDTGYASEIDGARMVAEYAIGWWPMPSDFPTSN